MTNLMVMLPQLAPRVRSELHQRLAAGFPELTVHNVGPPAEAERHIASTSILMAYFCPDELLAKAESLKWIQSLASGVDGFLSRPSLRADVLITRMQNVAGAPVAESILAMMFALSRQLPRMLEAQRSRQWDREPAASAAMLAGKTAGLVGVGQIAEALAPKLQALGVRVVGFSDRRNVAGCDRMRPRSELLAAVGEFDYLIMLVPHRPETTHIVDAKLLAAMKPSAFLINVSRGALVDDAALIEALGNGQIAGAALDVFVEEPLPPQHPLWSAPNLIITPHAAAMHHDYVDEIMPVLKNNIRSYLAGDIDRMIDVVRRPPW
jgi:D-2-hydroxyacid dehydrogenase (NADP+)